MHANIFVSISFIFFLYLAYKYIWPSFIQGLDEYIQNIKNKLSYAQKSIESQKQLNQNYQAKLENLSQEIADAKIEFANNLKITKQALENELDKSLKNKGLTAKQTIDRLCFHHKHLIQEKLADVIYVKLEAILKEDSTLQNNYMNIAIDNLREDNHENFKHKNFQ